MLPDLSTAPFGRRWISTVSHGVTPAHAPLVVLGYLHCHSHDGDPLRIKMSEIETIEPDPNHKIQTHWVVTKTQQHFPVKITLAEFDACVRSWDLDRRA